MFEYMFPFHDVESLNFLNDFHLNNSIYTLDDLNQMNFNSLNSERVGIAEYEDPEDFIENVANIYIPNSEYIFDDNVY